MQQLTKSIVSQLKEKFNSPIKSMSGKFSLVVTNIKVRQADYMNTGLQDSTLKRGGTLADSVLADVNVLDERGKSISKKSNHLIMRVPVKNQRKSYIVSGSEWNVRKQPRLKQAPFVKKKSTKDNLIEGQINAAGGAFRVIFDRETLSFKLKIKSSHFHLYSVLKDLGISDSDMQEAWGQDVWKVNAKRYKPDRLFAVYKVMRPYADTPTDIKAAVSEFFGSKTLDPRATKLTIGLAASSITPEVMLETSRKAVKVAEGDVPPDDTENLAYKNLFDETDILPKMIDTNWKAIERSIQKDLDRKQDAARLLTDKYFSKPIMGFFTTNELSGYTEAFNPLSIMRADKQITIMGEGGLGSTYAVEDKMRAVHPSYMGVIDPVATPEGQKIGITNHLSLGSRKIGNEFGLIVFDAKTGKKVEKTKAYLADKKIGFFKDFDINVNKPFKPRAKAKQIMIAMPDGTIKMGDPKTVDFVYPPSQYFFDAIGNSVPFVQNNCPNRVLMGTKHVSQAVALKDADRPLVQAEFTKGKGFEDIVGKKLNVAKVTGKVTKVKDGVIVIKSDKTKKNVKHFYHVMFPLSGSSFYNEKPLVKVGDTITAGDQLTSSDFNKKGDSLTLGKNLKTVYIPYMGSNFEDGLVISEGAAKKLTSMHKHEEEVIMGKGIHYGAKALAFYFPAIVDKIPLNKFDAQGLPKKGVKFDYGEVLLPAVMLTEISPDMGYDRLAKKKGNKPVDISVKWGNNVSGKVIDVIKTVKYVRVYLETEEPMTEGDKLSGRFGGKGIVVKILKDSMMPHTDDGSPADILFNPASIPNRVNTSQKYEAAASKIAKKTGKVFLADNFSDNSTLKVVRSALRKNGLDDTGKEFITVPETGTRYKALTGDVHFYKLTHLVRKKMHGRGAGSGVSYTMEEQPARGDHSSGQAAGALELYAMLAGGARHFLSDISTLLSQKNDDHWIAYQKGMPTPPPKVSHAVSKFVNYMRAAGVDLERQGSGFVATPLTDKKVLKMSSGEIKSSRSVNDKLQPEKGGLFDPEITGGFGSNKWNHITLTHKIPNPLAKDAIVSILGISDKIFSKVMKGELYYNTDSKALVTEETELTQGKAIEHMLKSVRVADALKKTTTEVESNKGAVRDKAVKRLRYLMAAKYGKKPLTEVYMMKQVPVLPTKFRPVYPNVSGQLTVSDPVAGYRDVILLNNQIKDLDNVGVDEKYKAEFVDSLYKAVGGLIGTQDMLSTNTPYKGLIRVVKGKMNKTGLFQGRVVSRRRDLSGRSTIIVDPKLGIDQVGIPLAMAKDMYKIHVVKHLNQHFGKTLIEARDIVESGKDTDMLLKALEDVMDGTPIALSRAPALHKQSVVMLKPQVMRDGRAIRMSPLIVQGLGADFDGDSVLGNIQLFVPVDTSGKAGLVTKYNGLPVMKLMRENLYNVDYKPSVDLAELAGTVPELGTKIPTVSIFSHQNSMFGVNRFVEDKDCTEVKIKTLEGREHSVSASHSLVIFDPEVDTLIKCKPGDSHYRAVPIAFGYDGELRTLFGLRPSVESLFVMTMLLKTRETGNSLVINTGVKNLESIYSIMKDHFKITGKRLRKTDKTVIVKEKSFIKMYKHVFKNGLLPVQVWSTTREYRSSLMTTLYSLGVVYHKKQFRIKIGKNVEEVRRLLLSLGVTSTTYIEPDNRTTLTMDSKSDAYMFEQWRLGWIPLNEAEVKHINKQQTSASRILYHKNYIQSKVMDRLELEGVDIPLTVYNRRAMARRNGFYFDIIKHVKTTGNVIPMYDLTVPGAMTFSMSDGMVVFDTVSVSLPFSEEAKKEAFNKLLPSKMLFDAKRNYGEALANGPSKEYVLGIYLMTKPVKIGKKKYVYSTELGMMKDFAAGRIKVNQDVKLRGRSSCAGQVLYKKIFPASIKIALKPTTAKDVDRDILEVAKNHKKEVASVIDKIKDHGAYYVTYVGYSVGLDDLEAPYEERDKIIANAEEKAKTVGFNEAFSEAKDLMLDLLKGMKDNNYVMSAIESGAFGRANSIQRMILSPVAVLDHENKPIDVPIRKSFAEGFTLPEYWLNIPGARKGLADKGLATADTGAFGKTILAAVSGLTITADDCKTTQGIDTNLTSSDVLDRVVASGKYKGKLMNTELQRNLIAKGEKHIVVRSPLKCELNDGVCKKCFGLLETGEFPDKGYPIGALAGTTAAERITQITLSSFHSGGSLGTKTIGWKQLKNILNTPKNIPRKRVLVEATGVVESIDKQVGGWRVVINGIKHFVPKELKLNNNVNVGSNMLAGDSVSKEGLTHPKELLDTTGDIDRVRNQMLSDLKSTYSMSGVKMKNKIFETLLVPLTTKVEIIRADPAVYIEYGIYPGAVISSNKAKSIKNKYPTTEYKAKVMGLREASHTTDDFVSELMSDELHKTIMNAPFIRKKAPLTGHPISEFVWGSIGQDPEDREKAERLLTRLEGVFGIVSDMSYRG